MPIRAEDWIDARTNPPAKDGEYIVMREENPYPTTRRYWHVVNTWQSSATVTHWMEWQGPRRKEPQS